MTSFLFWNVAKRDLRGQIAAAVAERRIDVLLLAESSVPDADLAEVLTRTAGRTFNALASPTDKVRLFTSLPAGVWTKQQEDPLTTRMCIWSARIGRHPGILIAAVHLVSKVDFSADDQALLTATLASELRAVERTVGHQRSVVVGDLNMNPFETGVSSAPCLHGVMTKKTAAQATRVVQGTEYVYLYNPMWGLFGDRTAGPPGTYYHNKSRPGELFWHMLDQVLVRPELMESIAAVEILDHVGTTRLTHAVSGIPLSQHYSDHLPLAFDLNLD